MSYANEIADAQAARLARYRMWSELDVENEPRRALRLCLEICDDAIDRLSGEIAGLETGYPVGKTDLSAIIEILEAQGLHLKALAKKKKRSKR